MTKVNHCDIPLFKKIKIMQHKWLPSTTSENFLQKIKNYRKFNDSILPLRQIFL